MEIYPTPEPLMDPYMLFAIVWTIIGLICHEISFNWYKSKLKNRVREDATVLIVRMICGWFGPFSAYLAYKFYKGLLSVE